MSDAAVKEDGRLSYPYDRASPDEAVLAGVLNALYWNPGVPKDHVKVEVSKGCVVLRGKVARGSCSELAENSASTTPGVLAVTNHITIEH